VDWRSTSSVTPAQRTTTGPSFDFDAALDAAADQNVASPVQRPKARPEWRDGQPLMQGFFGVSFYDDVSREGGNFGDVDGDAGDLDQLPLIGGGAQVKLGGDKLDYGFEMFFSFEGRANTTAFATGAGGIVIAGDVSLLIFDLYGGAFVSRFVGDNLRLYAGAGPLLQWADWDQDFGSIDASGSGFGVGGYVRTGFEFFLSSRTLVGLGVRWSDSTIDLDGGLGNLDIEGFQAVLTVSRGI
jgi:hypothetical protein